MRIFIISIAVGLLSSCVSLDTIQTGRSLGKDKHSISGSLSYGSGENIDYFSFQDNGRYFFGQARYGYGLKENIDLGLTVNLASFFIINSKYQIIGSKESFFASSLGIDIGATPLTLMHALTLSYMSSFKSYNSFHFGENLGFSFTPSYMFLGRSQFSEGYGGSYNNSNNYIGYTLGIFYGNRNKFFLETSDFKPIENLNGEFRPTISIGYSMKID